MQDDFNKKPFDEEQNDTRENDLQYRADQTGPQSQSEQSDSDQGYSWHAEQDQSHSWEGQKAYTENTSYQSQKEQQEDQNAYTGTTSYQYQKEQQEDQNAYTGTTSYQYQKEQQEDQNAYTGTSSYQYRKEQQDEQDIPRWKPYEETYKTVSEPEKPKKRWIIPLVIVLAIMVAAIIAGGVIGANRIRAVVSNASEEAVQVPDTQTGTSQISTTDTVNSGQSVVSGQMILTDVSDVVAEVMPSVVSITSRSLVDTGGYGDYFNFFFGGGYGGNSGGQQQEVESGIGSGTIISQNSTELLILTSYHVVEGSSSLYVTFVDDQAVDGYIKSQSEETDIAIVAVPIADIPEETLNSIKIAKLSTKEAEVGEGVIVIGNALGYGMSVTTGIISATNRQIQVDGKTLTVMQTDAAINAGNSGGCVVNSNGEVIGISEAKISVSSVEGMCYAIPVSTNTQLIQDLLNAEVKDESQQAGSNNAQGAYLGIRGRDIDSSLAANYNMPQGVYVAATIEGSGAQQAGLMEGDIIVGMDNVSFTTMSELQEQLSRHNPGDVVTLIIMREVNGSYTQNKIEVTLSAAIS